MCLFHPKRKTSGAMSMVDQLIVDGVGVISHSAAKMAERVLG